MYRLIAGIAIALITVAIGGMLYRPVTKFVNKGLSVYGEAVANGQTLPGK